MHMPILCMLILSGACLSKAECVCVCEWYCSRYLILLRDWGLPICTDFRSRNWMKTMMTTMMRAAAATTRASATLLTATIKYVEKNATQSNDHGIVIPQNANNSQYLCWYWWEFTRCTHTCHIIFSLLFPCAFAHPITLTLHHFPLRFGNWITT